MDQEQSRDAWAPCGGRHQRNSSEGRVAIGTGGATGPLAASGRCQRQESPLWEPTPVSRGNVIDIGETATGATPGAVARPQHSIANSPHTGRDSFNNLRDFVGRRRAAQTEPDGAHCDVFADVHRPQYGRYLDLP